MKRLHYFTSFLSICLFFVLSCGDVSFTKVSKDEIVAGIDATLFLKNYTLKDGDRFDLEYYEVADYENTVKKIQVYLSQTILDSGILLLNLKSDVPYSISAQISNNFIISHTGLKENIMVSSVIELVLNPVQAGTPLPKPATTNSFPIIKSKNITFTTQSDGSQYGILYVDAEDPDGVPKNLLIYTFTPNPTDGITILEDTSFPSQPMITIKKFGTYIVTITVSDGTNTTVDTIAWTFNSVKAIVNSAPVLNIISPVGTAGSPSLYLKTATVMFVFSLTDEGVDICGSKTITLKMFDSYSNTEQPISVINCRYYLNMPAATATIEYWFAYTDSYGAWGNAMTVIKTY